MNVIIRHATKDDITAILAIVNYAIEHTTAIYDYGQHTLEVQQAWFDEKIQKGFPVIVAEYDKRAVGFGTYGTFRQRDGYRFTVEHSVYVSNEFIGRGFGGMLLSELIKLAKEQKLHTMIGGIDASNKGSIEFHKKFGFIEVGNIKQAAFKFDRWLDLVFMQLILE